MKILLLGHGVANDGCMRLLDKYKLEYDYLDTDKVTMSSYDYIVKSPGIPLFDEVFSKISGTIISDIALGYILLKPRIIGITGSNGKTTIATMLYEVLKAKYKCILCGNIGYSFCDALLEYNKKTIYIVEISSFQLENISLFDFEYSIISNISLAHLDHHKTLDSYIKAKANITINQSFNHYFIFNLDNVYTKEISKNTIAKKISFSYNSILGDLFVLNGYIYYKYKRIIKVSDFRFKTENIMAVLAVSLSMKLSIRRVVRIISSFKEVKYRLTKINDYIYNNAKSTNCASTEEALLFLNNVILICGGYDRGIDIVLSKEALENISRVYVYGEAKDKLECFFKDRNISCEKYDKLNEAFDNAYINRKNEIILYSPMLASYDQYKSYTERGKEFDELVYKKIKDETILSHP